MTKGPADTKGLHPRPEAAGLHPRTTESKLGTPLRSNFNQLDLNTEKGYN